MFITYFNLSSSWRVFDGHYIPKQRCRQFASRSTEYHPSASGNQFQKLKSLVSRNSSVDHFETTILRSWFESQAQRESVLFQFIFELRCEKVENKPKEAGIGPHYFWQKTLFSHVLCSDIF